MEPILNFSRICCNQVLELPDDVSVIFADSTAADLSSSAMFTLKKVPYLFFDLSISNGNGIERALIQVKIDSYPLAISCAYNSRFYNLAVAFKKYIQSDCKTDDEKTFTNFVVRIYECESNVALSGSMRTVSI